VEDQPRHVSGHDTGIILVKPVKSVTSYSNDMLSKAPFYTYTEDKIHKSKYFCHSSTYKVKRNVIIGLCKLWFLTHEAAYCSASRVIVLISTISYSRRHYRMCDFNGPSLAVEVHTMLIEMPSVHFLI